MDLHELLARCEGFDWDEGNSGKNWDKHRVSDTESEQVFFNMPLVVASDRRHSERERRFYSLGRTDAGRHLFIAFTIRGNRVRVISARDTTRREREVYGHAEEQN